MATYLDINSSDIFNDLVDIESIKRSVLNIVYTERGSIPGEPEFGCSLMSTLFEPMNARTISTLQTVIEDALNKWEPRIYNIQVSIQQMPEFNKIICDLSFIIRQINTQENITFKLK
jgi:hypothetical protein